jgi:hypothetical protein
MRRSIVKIIFKEKLKGEVTTWYGKTRYTVMLEIDNNRSKIFITERYSEYGAHSENEEFDSITHFLNTVDIQDVSLSDFNWLIN